MYGDVRSTRFRGNTSCVDFVELQMYPMYVYNFVQDATKRQVYVCDAFDYSISAITLPVRLLADAFVLDPTT